MVDIMDEYVNGWIRPAAILDEILDLMFIAAVAPAGNDQQVVTFQERGKPCAGKVRNAGKTGHTKKNDLFGVDSLDDDPGDGLQLLSLYRVEVFD